MTTLSTLLLYCGVFVVGGLGVVVALMLTSSVPDTSATEDRPPPSKDEVDPIRSLSF